MNQSLSNSHYNNHLFGQNLLTSLNFFVAIIYVSVIYIVLGIFTTYELDKRVFFFVEKDFSEEQVLKTPMYILIFNVVITFTIISLVAYILRNIVYTIPFPFNFADIDYHGIREVYTGSVMIIILVSFSQTLSKQYKDIKYKLNGRIY